MATPKSQRIGIWVIAIVMIVGTIGSFLVMILANKNNKVDQAHIQQLATQYQSDYKAYQAKVDAQTTQLSGQYFQTFNAYASTPAAFNKDSVTKLEKVDLKQGDGQTLDGNSAFTAYYIGWTPDGKVFDSSINGSQLKAPLTAAPGGVIAGWMQGVSGVKIDGVRELTIPADLAYGSSGSGDKIPPNTPLKFVIMVIPTPAKITEPQPPQDLVNYYNSTTGGSGVQ